MRWWLVIVVAGIGLWWWQRDAAPVTDDLPQVAATPVDQSYPGSLARAPRSREAAGSTAVLAVELETLIDGDVGFDTLAKQGHYTVVEVYLDSCPICRRLEATYPAFLAARDDVVVRKVHAPEGGLEIRSSGETREEMEAEMRQVKARIDSFAVCGTPHIEVYAPDGALLAADRCVDKAGLDYLRDWITAETGLTST